MKLELYKNDVQTNNTGQEFRIEMKREQIAHFTRLFVTSNYSDPLKASIREILSNAFDANIEANPENPREVLITQKPDRVVIRDYGVGLSKERVERLYTVIGASSKRDSNNQIGAFGIGRLAPLALNKHFVVRSFTNKMCITYCVYLNDEGIPSIDVWDQEGTTEDNGLEVHILLPNSREAVFSTVYEEILFLIEGSRNKIDFKIDEEVKESFNSNYYKTVTKEKLLCPENILVSVENEEFKADFYSVSRNIQSSSYGNLSYEALLDMGGALYPLVITGEDDRREFRVLNSYSSLSREAYRSYRGLPLIDEEKIDQAENNKYLTTQERHDGKNYSGSDTTGTLVLRVPANFSPLTSSREELIKDKDTCKKICNAFIKALELCLAKSQENINEQVKRVLEHNSALSIIKYLIIEDNRLLKDARVIGNEKVNLEWEGKNGEKKSFEYTLPRTLKYYNRSLGVCLLTLVNNQLVIDRESPFIDNKSKKKDISFNVNFFKEELKTANAAQEHYLDRHYYCQGKIKKRPVVEHSLGLKEILLCDYNVVLSPNPKLVFSSLKKDKGESITDRPVLQIVCKNNIERERLHKALQDLSDLINYQGLYTHVEQVRKGNTIETIDEALRVKRSLITQLKSTNQPDLQWRSQTEEYQPVQKIVEKLTPEDFDAYKLYVEQETGCCFGTLSPREFVDKAAALPEKYLKQTEGHLITVTSNALQKLKDLGSKTNWKKLSVWEEEVKKDLVEQYNVRLDLIRIDRYKKVLIEIVKADGVHLLPEPTAEIATLSKDICKFSLLLNHKWGSYDCTYDLAKILKYDEQKDSLTQLYKSYMPSIETLGDLFGPVYKPYLPMIVAYVESRSNNNPPCLKQLVHSLNLEVASGGLKLRLND